MAKAAGNGGKVLRYSVRFCLRAGVNADDDNESQRRDA